MRFLKRGEIVVTDVVDESGDCETSKDNPETRFRNVKAGRSLSMTSIWTPARRRIDFAHGSYTSLPI